MLIWDGSLPKSKSSDTFSGENVQNGAEKKNPENFIDW